MLNKISLRDTENLKRELNEALSGPLPNFYVSIFKACLKADQDNLGRLAQAFPTEVALFKRYKEFGIDLTNEELVA